MFLICKHVFTHVYLHTHVYIQINVLQKVSVLVVGVCSETGRGGKKVIFLIIYSTLNSSLTLLSQYLKFIRTM